MIQIIPSIFVPTKDEFTSQIEAVVGHIDTIQLDIADGTFVDTTTWADPMIVRETTNGLKIELHLMVEKPIDEMLRWRDVPQVKRVLFHYESADDIEDCIFTAMNCGWMPSLVLRPETDVDVIAPYAEALFGVMLMGVHPGAQGQPYISNTTSRLIEVRTRFPHLFLELDGGVNMETLDEIVSTDLDAICPGSAIFGTGTPADHIKEMRKAIHTLQSKGKDV